MTSPLSILSSNHGLKPAFPRAGGCANLSPSLLSAKGCSPHLSLRAILPFSSHPLPTLIWCLGRIPGSSCLPRNTAMCGMRAASLASLLEGCEPRA